MGLTHSKRTGAKRTTLVKYLTLKIRFGELVIRLHAKPLPILLKYHVKRIFFANITGVEKNPWMTMKTDKRLHREMSSLENSIRNGDQLTLSNPNFLVNPTSAPPFLKELVRFI